jgi:hypothetical protein
VEQQMVSSTHQDRDPANDIGATEVAHYTEEMLESLRLIALQKKQFVLARLLELAAQEAKAQGKLHSQETRLPG